MLDAARNPAKHFDVVFGDMQSPQAAAKQSRQIRFIAGQHKINLTQHRSQ